MASILQRLCSNLHVARQTRMNSFCEKIALTSPAAAAAAATNSSRDFHCSSALSWLIPGAKLNVVDDSEIGRQSKAMNTPPKIIGILGHHTRKGRFKYAQTGDKVTVAIRGQVKWGYIVGCKIVQRPMIPKFDSNNVILVEKNGTPMGKRVFAPVPSMLRKRADGEFSKVLAICSKFY